MNHQTTREKLHLFKEDIIAVEQLDVEAPLSNLYVDMGFSVLVHARSSDHEHMESFTPVTTLVSYKCNRFC